MRAPSATGSVFRGTVGWLSSLLFAAATHAQPPDAVRGAFDLLPREPAADETWKDPCESPGESRVFKLPPTKGLEQLMQLLLDDPFAMPMEERSVSVVLVTKPLPCGERLLAARVELWDSLALKRRGGMARFFFRLGDWFGRSDPALSAILWFSDDGIAQKARKGYRLTRVLKFKKGSPWMGTINGYGVVVFPVASNSVSGATLTFKTEKLVPRKPGKSPKRVRGRRNANFVALPDPDDPTADPDTIRSKLGIDR